ncbi:flagellar biosynthesis protein FlhA [Motilimonas cestriensis]|uniref:Flagellar biosynthesis protein FlhA n=1 Tax=Motilimonas cestriensis TaxID=2742685 RepID=A0ABS8WH98_9GAMM|nr:flagellar biosynthesis protein FlhA [Motilimonas cestriensis]MCE2597108.1 flagellar biosynthesis protein FlhA [Motilimonas cestriensis]
MFKQEMLKNWHSNLFILGVVLILMVIFLPIPPALLDVLQILNFSIALLILLLTFCIDKPLSFSTFPSIILIATLFRLALNISATRLILGEGDAGEVIGAIGSFVVAGNYVIGFIVFIILIVVQWVVVTNGAQRVAEVAARFTLDSMPGKQMAIDADLNMGLIDAEEAKERRSNIEREANFYGSMDGATKFVKGDAIAGIIIILIDIVGGLAIGVMQNGMEWGDALAKYSLLTIGDGIVTQIPSLIIAVATGIIITRAATDSELSREIGKQIAAHPRTLLMVTFALFVALFLDGFPVFPIILIGSLFALTSWWAIRAQKDTQPTETKESLSEREDLGDLIKVFPIEVRAGLQLKTKIDSDEWTINLRLEALKKQVALEYGLILPSIIFKADKQLSVDAYEIHLQGTKYGKGVIKLDKIMAITTQKLDGTLIGEETKEPAYGLPAVWVDNENKELALQKMFTLVEPEMVLFTHLSELIKNNLYELVTRKEVESILARAKKDNASLVEELVPNTLTPGDIQRVLRLLLKEKVSIRYVELILEALAESSTEGKDAEKLTERVRERLASRLCDRYLDEDDYLNVITITPQLEGRLKQLLVSGGESGVDPRVVDSTIKQLMKFTEAMITEGKEPVLLCTSSLRAPLRKVIERVIPKLAVISAQEINGVKNVRTAGKVTDIATSLPGA